MKAIVCMKQVSDGKGPPVLGGPSEGTRPPGPSPDVNIYDLFALEAAMDLKGKIPGMEIAALTIGPEDAAPVVRYALARGADHAILIRHEEIAADNPFVVGSIIAVFAKLFGFSLVFCGIMSEDSCAATVPAFVAERLGWSWVDRVLGIEPSKEGEALIVTQKGEKGARFELLCRLPAVLACCSRIEGFQYVSMHRRFRVLQRPVQFYSREDLGMNVLETKDIPFRVLRTRNRKPRTKRTAIPSSTLSGQDLMWAMISGSGGNKRDDQLVRGNPDELADKILDLLLEKGLLDHSQLALEKNKEPIKELEGAGR